MQMASVKEFKNITHFRSCDNSDKECIYGNIQHRILFSRTRFEMLAHR